MEKKVYKLESITLVDSSFTRIPSIDFQSKELRNNVEIELEDNLTEGKLAIGVVLYVTGVIEEEQQYKFYNKFIGIFEVGDEDELPMNKFAKANGPAIIFPFIRENIAITSLKANLSPVMLPPINFLKLNTSQENQQAKS